MNLKPAKEPSRASGKLLPDPTMPATPVAPAAFPAKLILYPPDAESVEIALNQDVVTLGRDSGNRIVITSSYISSFHARFQRRPELESVELTDLGSNNGTRVNGRRIEKVVLRHGDMIQFGPALIARFETGAPPAKLREASSAAGPETLVTPEGPRGMTSQTEALTPPSTIEADPGPASLVESGEGGASLLAAQRAELEQLKLEARKRRNDLRAGEAQLKEVRAERDTLLVAVAQATDEHAKAKAAALAQDGAVRSARETLAELESGIQRLQETRARDQAAMELLQASLQAEAARADAVQVRITDSRREQESMEEGIRQRREEQAALARAIANRREELQAVEMGLERSRREVVQLNLELEEAAGLLENRRKELEQAASAVEGLRRQAEELKEETGILTAAKEKVLEESAACGAERENLEQQLAGMRAEVKTLREELAVARHDLAGVREALAAAGDDPQAVVAALEQQHLAKLALEKEFAQARAASEALQHESTLRTEELRATQKKIQEAAKQLKASGEQQQITDDRIARTRSELAALKAEGAKLAEEQEALQSDILRKAALEEEVRELESEARELKKANGVMASMAAGMEGLRKQIVSAEHRLQQLHGLIQDTETAAAIRQQEREAERAAHEARLRDWEARLVEQERLVAQEKQAAEAAILQARSTRPAHPAQPSAPPAISLFGDPETPSPAKAQEPEETLSLEEELVRMGFEIQPLKKYPKG